MGIFKNKEKQSATSVAVAPATVRTERAGAKEAISSIIAAEMELTGEMRFKGKARIDGSLTGNLSGEALILSETGRIEGDMDLESLVCHGQVQGNITAKIVTIHSSARIKGKLVAQSLTVEPGALLSGEISAADTRPSGPKEITPPAKGPQGVLTSRPSEEKDEKTGEKN